MQMLLKGFFIGLDTHQLPWRQPILILEHPMRGAESAAEAVQVMREKGLDLTRHEAQPLTEQLVRHADLIVTMTQSHRQAIVERWPLAAERTVLLSSERIDVADPIGQTIGAYRHCAEEIAGGLAHHIERLKGEIGK